MRIINTKGQLCPAPLIATKRALKETDEGDSFIVETDNKVSFSNISRYLKDNHIIFAAGESEGLWKITITRGASGLKDTKPEEYCAPEIPHFNKGDFVVAFTSDRMGQGSDELGELLLNNFVKAVKDLDALPSKMVFYNSGVMIGSEDSPVVNNLRELEKMGVGLFFCATCVDFYSLNEKIKIGSLSNIFEIAQIMASSGNVIKP